MNYLDPHPRTHYLGVGAFADHPEYGSVIDVDPSIFRQVRTPKQSNQHGDNGEPEPSASNRYHTHCGVCVISWLHLDPRNWFMGVMQAQLGRHGGTSRVPGAAVSPFTNVGFVHRIRRPDTTVLFHSYEP